MTPARPASARSALVAVSLALAGSVPSASAQDGFPVSRQEMGTDNNKPPPVVPVPVFFPPTPPPLERIARAPVLPRRTRYPVSESLSAYTSEIFYPALAARTNLEELKKRQRETVDRYREDKRALQYELETELSYIVQQPRAARPPLLAALGQKQNARIAELERRAEELRDDLARNNDAWTAVREWSLGETKRASETPAEISKVMLSAAYFQDGLSADQRHMLREIAIEVTRGGDTEAAAMAAQPYVFFSPSPARVRFPEEIPDAVAAKLASYESRKSALRKELYDAVYVQDSAWFDVRRTAALKTLGRQQAAEFAVLEEIAEEIRRDLAPAPPPARLKPIAELPPVLAQRLVAMFRRPVIEQLRIRGEVAKIQGRYPDWRISAFFSRNLFVYDLRLAQPMMFSSKTNAQRKQVEQELNALGEAYKQVVAVLMAERDAVRPELAAALATNDPAMLDLALNEGLRQMVEEDAATAARNYYLAVFEPGLSPGQRRLLFDLAMVQLDLPLPGGEPQPIRRATSPRGPSQ